ncbi:MAG: tRNA 2-selenouridine(34) synthase MnmH [Bacteroidales bacterium]|nr:tRNA 2-selenouridine(34) synthase MnmH [Bacteroidales bacterium]
MIVRDIESDQFMYLKETIPVVDVRSPSEYRKGHVPGAFNIPLFTDEERAEVGTLYHHSGRDASLIRALDLTGPKLSGYVKTLKSIIHHNRLLLYCWRGGMRSEALGWLFNMSGYQAMILKGGYKAYRSFIRESLGTPGRLVILGGMTCSGKSEVLKALQELNEQVIDLETLACHKGSVFGHLGQDTQPTNEQYENDIHEIWYTLDSSRRIWIEDESRSLGKVGIPDPLFRQICTANTIVIDSHFEYRLKRALAEYARYDHSCLSDAIDRIVNRLGDQQACIAKEAIDQGDYSGAAEILLSYYDKAYEKSLTKRDIDRIRTLTVTDDDPVAIARLAVECADQAGF